MAERHRNVHLDVIPCDYCDRRAILLTARGYVCARHEFGPSRADVNEVEAHRRAESRLRVAPA